MNVDADALRTVVREILVELLDAPGQGLAPNSLGARSHRERGDDATVVTLNDDADLRAFVLHVLQLAEDPVRREGLRNGQIRFRLGRATEHVGAPGPTEHRTLRVDRGALTEKVVVEAARDGHSIVLARGAVATPLALEKARSLGVSVHKEAT